MSAAADDAFRRRRAAMKARIDPLDRELAPDGDGRKHFFDTVYAMAEGDAAGVPWADLAPKVKLAEWLAGHPGDGRRGADVACGLGDNAEAIAAAGYDTVAFDVAAQAIRWARERFAGSAVDYRVADVFDPPPDWIGGFDLVNECYTIQSVPPPMQERMSAAIARLVKPGGVLLVYARIRGEGTSADGPPWPLMPSQTAMFADLGFDALARDIFDIVRPDRTIAHEFSVWRRQD